MKICRAIGGEGEPWARMHGTLPLGQQHYHFINPAGEVEGCAHYNHFINRGRWRAQQCTLISPLHTAWPSIHPNWIFALTPISSGWNSGLPISYAARVFWRRVRILDGLASYRYFFDETPFPSTHFIISEGWENTSLNLASVLKIKSWY